MNCLMINKEITSLIKWGVGMYWKLRIPLFLFVMGVTSGSYQRFSNFFLVNTSYFIRSIVFIGLIGMAALG